MTLADKRLEALGSPSLTEEERLLLRCNIAADFIHKGQYEAAREALSELWSGIGKKPNVEKLPPAVAAEVLLQCGTLTRLLGGALNMEGSQELAKDLLTEAAREFYSQGNLQKAAEAHCELGACYWRLGAHDEGRVIMREALNLLTDVDVELKAKIHIRRTLVEISENKFYEALNILKEAEPVFAFANEVLKGKWHGQMALVLARLADLEGNADYVDKAVVEFTAAIYHYEQAKHERYCAVNLNNLAMLLYRLGRYRDAHEHLDRAGAALMKLKDGALLAQVDETRARVFIAEKKYNEADRVITRAVRTLEQGGESALLADALAVQGVAWARLGSHENSLNALRRAVDMAESIGAFTNAGLAALAIVEEHGPERRMSQDDVFKTYLRADRLLKDSQDVEDLVRLRACARIVVSRLAGMQFNDKNFSFYSAVHELEAKLIERALEEAKGSVVRAAKLLGLKHQTFTSMLQTRHQKLLSKRTPRERRLKSIIKELKE